MNKLSVALAFLAIAAPAYAADVPLPVKAPAVSNVYPNSKCGFFYGLNAEGSSSVVNGAPAGTVEIGGDIGALVGWACPNSPVPWFIEADFDFQNLNAGNAGFALTGPAHFTQVAAIQTPLLSWFSQWINIGQSQVASPSSILPMLPPGVTINGTPQNYVGATVTEDDISVSFGNASNRNWLISPGVRTGLLFNLTGPNGTQAVGDTYVGLDVQSNAVCLGVSPSLCPKLGTRWVAGFSLKM